MAEPQIRYCTTTDGVSIAYYAMGEGETLLIMSAIIWGNIRYPQPHSPEYQRTGEGVGRGMRVLRYDSRGSGMSERATGDFSIEARLRDLDAVIAKAAPPTFTVFGAVQGGLTAVECAARHPDRVSRLILYTPIVDGRTYRDQIRRWDSLRAMAADDWTEYTLTMAAANVGHDKPELVQLLAARMREAMHPAAVQAAIEAVGEIDVTPSLAKLSMPVLLLYREGAARLVAPEQIRRIAAAIPDCELVHTQGGAGEYWSAKETDAVERFLGIPPDAGAQGAVVTPPEQRQTPRPSSGGLQTILFTDIEANTELLQRVGDAAWREVLREHEHTTRALLAEHGGTEIKTIGDAFMTAFNTASAAIECAIALQGAFDHDPAQLHASLRLRIGINAGEPIAEDAPDGRGDLFGTAVTTASRIQSLAKGGEILVSDVVRQLVAGKGFLFDDRGEHVLRGFEDPVHIFAVRVSD